MKIHGIEITHPDRLYFPRAGLTKADIVTYYARVADRMLVFLKQRPLTLQRFPEGVGGEGFYQKNIPESFSPPVAAVTVKTEEGSNRQAVCNTPRALMFLVNQGCLSFHVWLSRTDRLDRPDRVVFDLDPPAGKFSEARQAAVLLRDYLREKNLDPRVMLTGKNGLHVYYTIRRDHEFDTVRHRVRSMADELAASYPDLLTTHFAKRQRRGRVLLDYLRNAYGQTAICPFSLRPTPDASIAVPIDWDELATIRRADRYHPDNLFRRLAQKKT